MRVSKLLAVLLAVGGAAGVARVASATIYLDWADEFLGGRVSCDIASGTGTCYINHAWDATDNGEPPRWAYVGAQGASAGGRANVIEKVATHWYERSAQSYGISVNLARVRVTPAPSHGAACTSGVTQTFVGSVSYTKDSTVFQDADWDLSMRLKPTYSFFQETAGAGTTLGYRSTITVTSLKGMNSSSDVGCYKISWI